MLHEGRRTLLFVVDHPSAAVELVSGLSGVRRGPSLNDARRALGTTGFDLLLQLIHDYGYDAALTFTGPDAIRRIDRGPRPDALVLDCRKPLSHSLEVLRHARRRYPTLPLFLTCDEQVSCSNADVDLEPPLIILRKPLNFAEFALSLTTAANHHRTSGVRLPLFVAELLRTSVGNA